MDGFYELPGDKRKTREHVSAQLSDAGDLVTHSTVKAAVLNIFFTSILTSRTSLQASRPQKPQGRSGARNACPCWKRIRLQILKQITHASIQGAWWDECSGSWLMSLRDNSWQSWNDHGNWDRYLKNGGKEVLLLTSENAERSAWNYRQFSLITKPGNIMDQAILWIISRCEIQVQQE